MTDQASLQGTVMVLDDEPLTLQTTVGLLRLRGIRALPAHDADELYALLDLERPDLILLDIVLEGQPSGYDICRQLKADPATRDIPIIFLSGLAETSSIVEGFDAGAVDYCTKPIMPQELRARVGTHLALARASRELEDRVRARTSDLARANETLRAEIVQREQAQDSLRLHSERLELLRAMERGILSSESPETIARAAAAGLGRLIRHRWVGVLLCDDGSASARIVAEEGAIAVMRPGTSDRVPLDNWADTIARLDQGQTVTMALRPDHGSILGDLYAGGARSTTCVSLRAAERLVGLLCLAVKGENGIHESDLAIAHQVSAPLSIAIQQAELRQQIRRHNRDLEQRVADRTRELRALYNVAAAASESLPLENLLQRVLESATLAVGCTMGCIHLLQESDEPPRVVASVGVSEAGVGAQMAVFDADCLDILLSKGQCAGADCQALSEAIACHLGVERVASACVAMRVAGRVLGVLCVHRVPERGAFDRGELVLLHSIGDQVGAAIESFQLRERAEQAVLIEERQRLARELHDSVTQSLYSAMLLAAGGRLAAEQQDLASATQVLARVQDVTQQALKEMRLLVYELRPPILEKEGLVGALQRRLDAVETRSGMRARLLVEGEVDLAPRAEEALFRIVTEALNNSLKHAEASVIEVHIATENGCVLAKAWDDGLGFVPGALDQPGGMGLHNMRERAEQLGGTVVVESAPGEGTLVRVRFPMASSSATTCASDRDRF